jgi:hypothetical protein
MCNPINIRIGNHDTGKWDLENKVYAAKNPVADDLTIDEAIAKAKASPGSELVVADLKTGKASVHKIFMDDAADEEKSIKVSELVKDGIEQGSENPLLIEDNIAQRFGGKTAFLVDDKNNLTFLGNDPDKSDAGSKLKEAAEFIDLPTNKDKKDIAALIAKEVGSPEAIEKKLTSNIIAEISKTFPVDYKPDAISEAIAALNPGLAKTRLESIKANLNVINGQYTAELKSHNDKIKGLYSEIKMDNMKEVKSKFAELRAVLRPEITSIEKSIDSLKKQIDAQEKELITAPKEESELAYQISYLENSIQREVNARHEARKNGSLISDPDNDKYLEGLDRKLEDNKKALRHLTGLPYQISANNKELLKKYTELNQANDKQFPGENIAKENVPYLDLYNKLDHIIKLDEKFNKDNEPYKQKAKDLIQEFK